mgnify:CR=1 FL=1
MIKKKEVFSNIFDAASQLGKKKPKEPVVSPRSTEKEEALKQSDESLDVDKMFERCSHIYSTIKNTIEKAYATAHLSPKEIEEFLSTPSNFTSYQWKLIQEQKKELSEKLQKLSQELLTKEELEKEKEPSKKVKSKSMIEKNRWVQM